MSIEILRSGMFTTIQDRGRYGYRRDGVVTSGAMDGWAWQIANALVGNCTLDCLRESQHLSNANLATLEFFLVGPSIQFHKAATIAIYGGRWNVLLNNEQIYCGRPYRIQVGDKLDVRDAIEGCWGYLAIHGGIDVPVVLNSRSTHVRSGLGGYGGRCLAEKDRLGVSDNQFEIKTPLHAWSESCRSYVPWNTAIYDAAAAPQSESKTSVTPIRFVSGTHWDLLSLESQRLFLESAWMVTKQSDRMGYRLTITNQTSSLEPLPNSRLNNSSDLDEAPKLRLSSPFEMLSEPTVHGTIQLPPSGDPIVLMADAATTGGYPRIGYVSKIDIDYLAQHRPGEYIRFEKITTGDSFQLMQSRAKTSRRLMQGILFQ